ncbi:MAG: hypothetical protein R6U37_02355 [Dehalococcoidia bacterium]
MAKCIAALVTLVVLSIIVFACNDDESSNGETAGNNVTRAEESTDTIDYALAVYLEMEEVPGIDYTKAPLKVKGAVSHPQATVTVNGLPTDVAEDGSFSCDVSLTEGTNSMEAVARYADAEDSWLIMVDLSPEGNLTHVPGLGSGWQRYASKLIYDHNVDIKAGETKSIDITLENGKPRSGPGPADCTYTISLVSSEYSEQTVPMPMGLDISVEPSKFTAYSNTNYHSTLTISTTPGLVGCKYYLLLKGSLEGGFTEQGWITVEVQRGSEEAHSDWSAPIRFSGDCSIMIQGVGMKANNHISIYGGCLLPETACIVTQLLDRGEVVPWWPGTACATIEDGNWRIDVPLGENNLEAKGYWVYASERGNGEIAPARYPFSIEFGEDNSLLAVPPSLPAPGGPSVCGRVSGLLNGDRVIIQMSTQEDIGNVTLAEVGNGPWELVVMVNSIGTKYYTVTADAEGYRTQPPHYTIAADCQSAYIVRDGEIEEEAVNLDFKFIPDDR